MSPFYVFPHGQVPFQHQQLKTLERHIRALL